jgi:predicted MFS family arabinose efflux permease
MAIACLGIEAVGLLILSWAPSPTIALMGAALAGLGLSIVYPALGIEVLGRIPPSCRSAGLGAYAIFFDLALGVAGPLMGVIAGHYGYPSIFLVSAALAGFGMMLAGFLALNQRQTSTGR